MAVSTAVRWERSRLPRRNRRSAKDLARCSVALSTFPIRTPTVAHTATRQRLAAQRFSNNSKGKYSSGCLIRRTLQASSSSRFKGQAVTCPRRSFSCKNCSGFAGSMDEGQAGMGRRGKGWACEHAGIEPDIVCAAKGIASGMPLGAIVAKESVMRWKPGSHGTTFGGNPVCIAAALATMDLIESEYMENARRMGDYLFGRLANWTKNFKIVGDVRGRGLMIGIEIVRDQRTKEKAADLRNDVVNLAFHKGLLVLGAGENSVRLSPPLLIDQEQADFAVRTLEECFREVEKKL